MEGIYSNGRNIFKWKEYIQMEGLYSNGRNIFKWKDYIQIPIDILLYHKAKRKLKRKTNIVIVQKLIYKQHYNTNTQKF